MLALVIFLERLFGFPLLLKISHIFSFSFIRESIAFLNTSLSCEYISDMYPISMSSRIDISTKKLFFDDPLPLKVKDSLKSSTLTLIHRLSPFSTIMF